MNKQANINCKIILAKSNPNLEAEIFAIGEVPASLADLNARIQKSCLRRLPNKYNIYYEDLSDNLHLVSTEAEFKALVQAFPVDKSRTIRFHVNQAFEKTGDSLFDLEKQLEGLASFEPDGGNQMFKKLEDIAMTVSVVTNQIGQNPTGAGNSNNFGSQGFSAILSGDNYGMNMASKEQSKIPQNNFLEDFNFELGVKKNYYVDPIHEQKIDSVPYVPANMGVQNKEQHDIEEKKSSLGSKILEQKIEKSPKENGKVDLFNFDQFKFSQEQTEAIREIFDQRFRELEAQFEAKYDALMENKIHKINQQWSKRFDGLQTALIQLRVPEKQPINKPVEDPKVEQQPKINNNPPKKVEELPGQKVDQQREMCSICKTPILNGIKYECLTCAGFKLCQGCSNNVGHQHRLVKIEGFVPVEQKLLDADILGEITIRYSYPYQNYGVAFLASNTGSMPWPATTFLECLTGFHLGEIKVIGAVQSGRQENVVLKLDSPTEPGTYTSYWRFCYKDPKTSKKEFFGPKFAIEAKLGQPNQQLQQQPENQVVNDADQDVNEPPEIREKINMLQSFLLVDKKKAKEIVSKNPKANVQELIDLSLS